MDNKTFMKLRLNIFIYQVDKLNLIGYYGVFHEQYKMWSVWKSHISFCTVCTKSMHSVKWLI